MNISLGNNHAHLGCCGYDDMGYKPPTTTPMSSNRKPKVVNSRRDPGIVRPIRTLSEFGPAMGSTVRVTNWSR